MFCLGGSTVVPKDVEGVVPELALLGVYNSFRVYSSFKVSNSVRVPKRCRGGSTVVPEDDEGVGPELALLLQQF